MVFAIAEFDPAFTDRVAILADRKDGAPLPPNAAPFQLVITGEKRPARWVRQVVAIELMSYTARVPRASATTTLQEDYTARKGFSLLVPLIFGDKDFQLNYQKMVQLVESGHREIFTIVD